MGEVRCLIPTQRVCQGKRKSWVRSHHYREKGPGDGNGGQRRDGEGTRYLGCGTLEFQQDQGTGTLHNVEIKQEGFVPGVGERRWKLNHLTENVFMKLTVITTTAATAQQVLL